MKSGLLKFSTVFAALLFSASTTFAQEAEMADTMRSNGKIYVLVAVMLVLVLGLAAYLFFMDKKLSRLEEKMETESRIKK